jgi:23S rRNA (guanosine2251-2'-O)-methyltransferase
MAGSTMAITSIVVSLLAGIHPVREALRAGRPIDRVLIARGAGGPRIQEIVDLCRERGVPVRFEPRDQVERAAPGATHQGIIAYAAAHTYSEISDVPVNARLVVVLDGIEDPHNLGAIIRTANAAGADAVIIPDRRAVGLTDTVAKAAAGALEYTPIIRVGNLNQAIDKLKGGGFWIYGLDERGGQSYDAVEFAEPAAILLGAEGRGLHEHTRKRCDHLVRIPMAGKIASLNVSVAAGIVLFEWKRRNQSGPA